MSLDKIARRFYQLTSFSAFSLFFLKKKHFIFYLLVDFECELQIIFYLVYLGARMFMFCYQRFKKEIIIKIIIHLFWCQNFKMGKNLIPTAFLTQVKSMLSSNCTFSSYKNEKLFTHFQSDPFGVNCI